jgi:PTS system nitrogen regulatory IIA component
MRKIHVISGINARSPREVFRQIAFQIGSRTGLEPSKLYDSLCRFEKQDHSGIGGGVAIPHGKLAYLDAPLYIFARLNNEVDFNSNDQAPVDLVFVVLSPEADGPIHLKRLAYVTRMARDEPFCACLRGGTSEDALNSVLMEQDFISAQAA